MINRNHVMNEAFLNEVCVVCGNRRGEHAMSDDRCPRLAHQTEGPRFIYGTCFRPMTVYPTAPPFPPFADEGDVVAGMLDEEGMLPTEPTEPTEPDGYAMGAGRAPEILARAQSILAERGSRRDLPSGERSMGRAVAIFNAVRGESLVGADMSSTADGWLFMVCLKLARMQAGKFTADDHHDAIGYLALHAEEVFRGQE